MHDHEHEQLHDAGVEHEHNHEHCHEHSHAHEHGHAHEHEHCHEHVHEHTHPDGTVHSHEHSHSHSHPHGHTHEAVSGFDSVDQAMALMGYMLDHNRHHAEELHELCHKLEATGKGEAAKLIHDAVDHFGDGNDLLAAALEKLKQE